MSELKYQGRVFSNVDVRRVPLENAQKPFGGISWKKRDKLAITDGKDYYVATGNGLPIKDWTLGNFSGITVGQEIQIDGNSAKVVQVNNDPDTAKEIALWIGEMAITVGLLAWALQKSDLIGRAGRYLSYEVVPEVIQLFF